MSIYVIKSRGLYKVGFSSNLPARVKSLMDAVPGASEFVGHMPGGMDVEAHLHGRFHESRFSGEWFSETPRLLAFIDACLDPVLPEQNSRTYRRPFANEKWRVELADRVRKAAALAWPETTHKERVINLAALLGWNERRVKCVYTRENYTLLANELPALERWLADWIAPELAETEQEERGE